MAALGSQTIASSYEQLLHVDRDGGGNTTTHVSLKDGDNGTTFGFTIATDALMMTSTNRLEFGDTGTYIHQSADGVLDLVSDTEIELTATTIDINGAVAMNGAMTGGTNITISGELDAATLDISGNADIDGTLEADAITVDGTALATFIRDTVGTNMLSSNSESGITVTYDTTNDNIDFAVDAAQTGITSLLAADIKIGEDNETKIDFEDVNEIHFYANNTEQVYVADNIFGPQSDSDVDLGTTGVRWKDAFVDSITVTGEIDGASLDIEGNADINGTTNLDAVDIDGAVDMATTLQVTGAVTASGGMLLNGTTPTLTVGDGGAEDAKIIFDGNALDFHIGLDDSEDKLTIGKASTLGAVNTKFITIDENGLVTLPDNHMVINASGNGNNLTLTSTDADANVGPNLRMYRNSSSPANNDQLGKIVSAGRNNNSQDVVYAEYISQIKDITDGSEDGRVAINTMSAGSLLARFDILPTETVFNEGGVDLDFRVESTGNANMIFVDAANNKVGIGTNSPAEMLHVASDAKFDGNIKIATSGKGIDFSATSDGTTMSSELLDDYEEGLHTTAITGTDSGSWVLDAANQKLVYTKIGRMVTVSGKFETDSGSGAGTLKISMPFTCADLDDSAELSVGSITFNRYGSTSIATQITPIITSGNNFITIQVHNTGNADESYLQADNVDGTFEGQICISYIAA